MTRKAIYRSANLSQSLAVLNLTSQHICVFMSRYIFSTRKIPASHYAHPRHARYTCVYPYRTWSYTCMATRFSEQHTRISSYYMACWEWLCTLKATGNRYSLFSHALFHRLLLLLKEKALEQYKIIFTTKFKKYVTRHLCV